jgi:predicted phage terminase large subunit-like protein
MLKDATFRTFCEIGRKLRFIKDVYHGDLRVVLGNGAEVLFRSADNPERLRGPNLSGVWLDEASLIDRAAYDIVLACLREHGEMGWLSATFTPAGQNHWTYDVFGKNTDGAALFHSTTYDNPFLPANFYATVKDQYSPIRARQELGGEFVNIEGAEWPAEWFEPRIWFDEWPKNGLKVITLDPSKGRGDKWGDYSAFITLWYADGIMYVDADMANDRNLSTLIEMGVDMHGRWKPDAFGCESVLFQELILENMVKLSEQRGIPFNGWGIETQGVPKEVRIRRLTPFLSRNQIRFKGGSPGAELLVRQLMEFPNGDHDDGPDALEMAVRLVENLSGGTITEVVSNLSDRRGQ